MKKEVKFISWNVNGIRASWAHGLSELLYERKADIYALQETRVNEPFLPAELDGYCAHWSFCETRRGYSGTLVLSKSQPLRVIYDMTPPWCDTPFESSQLENFSILPAFLVDIESQSSSEPLEIEGRIITLEFREFWFVTIYAPNPKSCNQRKDYRSQWDERLRTFLGSLQFVKPVVLCGDFNTTAEDRDIYPENATAEIEAEGFGTTERENLRRLLNEGYIDTYRALHPDTEHAYTWWSNRRNKRLENRGWRLDYFLISEELRDSLKASNILSDVHGSDHCPILLELNIKRPKSVRASVAAQYLDVRDILNIDPNGILGSLRRTSLSAMWRSVPWAMAEERINKLQANLAQAAYKNDPDVITHIQQQIAFSLEAKLIAVRHVCTSGTGPGIDGIRWVEDHEKMIAAMSLTAKGYRASPYRMVVIRSKGGKERRIRIPTYYDRAMQTLYAMTLAPIAEARADRKSFAFRRGKSMLEMNDFIKLAFSPQNRARRDGSVILDFNPPEWAYVCDVRQCYANISQQWLINNIPMEKRVLTEFLRAGYIFDGELFPSDSGIGLGLSLSPILANMTLDGLQSAIYDALYPRDTPIDYPNGNMIRYADDIIVTARTHSVARRMESILAAFLKPRGLTIADDKSQVININDGFEFMSRFYIKESGLIRVYPAEEAVTRFMADLEELVFSHTGSQQSLIEKLNRKLTGWSTYHKVEDAMDSFRQVDAHLKAILLQLCVLKHPKWSMDQITQRYWYQRADGEFLFALKDKKEIHVRLLRDVVLSPETKGKLSVNPYINAQYLADYSVQRSINSATGPYHAIWLRQNGRCFYCGRPILQDQSRTVVDANVGEYGDVYVHLSCIENSIEYVDTDTFPSTAQDTLELLQAIQRRSPMQGQKFLRLGEFFRSCNAPQMTLTFDEIEKHLGQPLGTCQKQRSYWSRTGFMCISQAWLENGYEIQRLDIPNRKIVFCRTFQKTSNLTIPEVFLTSRIPDEAKYELENYFAYIRKKYAL